MKENTNYIESFFESAIDYGKTSFELFKLKAIDKISDVVSSILGNALVIFFLAVFLIFFNLGLALWIGELLGKTYFGFFIVAAFYAFIGIFIHLFMHRWFKKIICNYILKQVFK